MPVRRPPEPPLGLDKSESASPDIGPMPPSGADRIKAIGEAADRMAQRYASHQTDAYRRRILADHETRQGHRRHVRRHLFEMARRFEDYASVYDCARELRDFVESLGGPLKPRTKKQSGP